ncbi:MAG: hypothetical protein AB7K52_12990 [Phycisphaerales bacterium]
MNLPRFASTMTLALACAAFSCPALAQSEQKDVLKGPSVQDREVPGTVGQFAGTPESGKFRPREVRPQVFMEALMSALGPDAPESIRASDQQREQLRALSGEFRKRVQAYMAEHRADFEKLGTDARRNRRDKDAGKNEDRMNDAERESDRPSEETIARAKALRDGMPSASDLYTKVWEVLSAEQRAAVEARLEALHHEKAVQEGRDYVKRRIQKNQPVQGQAPGLSKERGKFAPGRAKGEQENDAAIRERLPAELRERLLRAFERLSPEERENLLNRLEQRFREREGRSDDAAPARRDRPKQREKPAGERPRPE